MKSVCLRFVIVLGMSLLFGIMPTIAQSNTIIALQADNTAVETGQYYIVTVYLQDVSDVWQINAEIEYDPTLVYVVGTISGSPMTEGNLFAEEPELIIRNSVTTGQMIYTHSLVSPAIPKSGSGSVATFQIYPLSAGTTQIRFTKAVLTRVTFTQGEDGEREVENTEDIPVLPALLDLTITGETVPPPDESTPTPEPTATTELVGRGEIATAEPTLVNVTLAPAALPTLIPDIEGDSTSGSLPILPIAIGLLLTGVIGGIVLLVVYRRQ
jgi:hypothetical protein